MYDQLWLYFSLKIVGIGLIYGAVKSNTKNYLKAERYEHLEL